MLKIDLPAIWSQLETLQFVLQGCQTLFDLWLNIFLQKYTQRWGQRNSVFQNNPIKFLHL